MTDNTEKSQAENSSSAIRPAEITLSAQTQNYNRQPAATPGNHSRWLWPAMLIMTTLTAAVVFVLPAYVKSPALSAPTTATGNEPPSGPAKAETSKPKEPAPWQTAQLARQRTKSQELLSRMLELQEQLEQKNVKAWAAAEYEHILQLATDGDTAYQQQDFDGSSAKYTQAADEMSALLENTETLFNQKIELGNTALANGEASPAEQAFTQALQIKPDAESAKAGMQRAQTLNEVLKLVTEGNDLQQSGQLEQARSRYEQALKLDKQTELAKQQLSSVNTKIRDADFKRLMSTGYTQLQNNHPAEAKAAFEKAARLKPGSSETGSALGQIDSRLQNDKINDILQTARELESNEKWKEAMTQYDQALALDANLAAAQEGKQYASSRVTLDERLAQLINQPERLANTAVYEDARLLYQQAQAITPAEPGLSAQLQKLDKLLAVANVPVPVLIKSDNQTEVMVLRVGTLGKFSEKNLSLLPGKYTAVGSRKGYRDVRVDITVTAGAPAQTVEVSATEKFASR